MQHSLIQRLARAFHALSLLVFAGLSLGCASYRGTAKDVQPSALERAGDWVIVPSFPRVLQQANHDCGAAALSAVLGFWGRSTSPEQVATAVGRTGERLSASDLERYAKQRGLSSYVFFGTMADITYELGHGRPVIVGLGKPYEDDKAIAHYEVVVGYEPHKQQVLLLDPARGFQVDSFEGFAKEWSFSKGVTVVAFLSESARPAPTR